MRWQEPNDVGGWRSMQIVEVVPHPYCPTCFTDRSAAPPSRPGACCLIENSCRPLSENRVAFWSHRRFQRLRGDRAAAVETNPHLFGRFMSQICIRVWDRKAVGEHDRAPALEAQKARPADHASLRFDPPLSMAQPR